MRRGIFCLLIAMLLLSSQAGCSKDINYIIDHEPHFSGIVEAMDENYIVVSVTEGNPMLDASLSIQVSLNVERKDCFLSFAVGDEVAVYYDGNTTDGKVETVETVYAILLRNPVCREID